MAKETYLELGNRVLRRISKDEVAGIPTSNSIALIVFNFINEAQTDVYNEESGQWYSLYTERTFTTSASTGTYAVNSDFGKAIYMVDETNDNIIWEEGSRWIASLDPDRGNTGEPIVYSLEGSNYRLYPTPAGTYTIRDVYFKQPDKMSLTTDTSDLPIECENLIIERAYYKILNYLQRYEAADRVDLQLRRMLKQAKKTNKKKLNRMFRFRSDGMQRMGPRLPSNYPMGY